MTWRDVEELTSGASSNMAVGRMRTVLERSAQSVSRRARSPTVPVHSMAPLY